MLVAAASSAWLDRADRAARQAAARNTAAASSHKTPAGAHAVMRAGNFMSPCFSAFAVWNGTLLAGRTQAIAPAATKQYQLYFFSGGNHRMRLTLYSDYSLRLLMYAAIRHGELVTIQDVADAYGISRNHLMKVAFEL